jgi:hypothetical protein
MKRTKRLERDDMLDESEKVDLLLRQRRERAVRHSQWSDLV